MPGLSLLDPCRWQTCRLMQWTTDLSVCICVLIEPKSVNVANLYYSVIYLPCK